MALALYRKYRPQTLGEVVGQETVIEILRNAAQSDRLAHAYLFYGSRGTGKTSVARLVAKLLNCETRANDASFRKKGEPCNTCSLCVEFSKGIALDLIEIDAASNRGIDEIRNLKESIRVAPSRGRYKIYIIDEAHMLTRDAFNALLKTLEEPPPHAVLILATTEYEKLPATITSRTQRFLFKKLPKTAILEKLETIAKEETISIEPAALELIAAIGEGSLRDAESLLDQMSATQTSKKEPITLTLVERITGRTALPKVGALAEAILKNDLQGSLAMISEINEEGHNLVQLTKDLIHYMRKLISLHLNPDLESFFLLELTKDECARLKELSSFIVPELHSAFTKSLIRAYSEMRYSPFALVPLEIALIEHLNHPRENLKPET